MTNANPTYSYSDVCVFIEDLDYEGLKMLEDLICEEHVNYKRADLIASLSYIAVCKGKKLKDN